MKKQITWIVVFDGSRARIFQNDGPGKGVKKAMHGAIIGDMRENRDIMSDKQGRSFDSGGQGRHAMEPSSDPKRIEQQRFVGGLVEMLESELRKGAFDRLILAAAPRALGDLRKMLPAPLANTITSEIAKDLTHTQADKMASHLEGVLAV